MENWANDCEMIGARSKSQKIDIFDFSSKIFMKATEFVYDFKVLTYQVWGILFSKTTIEMKEFGDFETWIEKCAESISD